MEKSLSAGNYIYLLAFATWMCAGTDFVQECVPRLPEFFEDSSTDAQQMRMASPTTTTRVIGPASTGLLFKLV